MDNIQILHLENGDFKTVLSPKFQNRKHYEAPKNVVTAAIPGTIMSVMVKEGQRVKRGDALCVLDSMKMNNTICAPDGGVVKKVHIAVGDSVGKNAPMVEFE